MLDRQPRVSFRTCARSGTLAFGRAVQLHQGHRIARPTTSDPATTRNRAFKIKLMIPCPRPPSGRCALGIFNVVQVQRGTRGAVAQGVEDEFVQLWREGLVAHGPQDLHAQIENQPGGERDCHYTVESVMLNERLL